MPNCQICGDEECTCNREYTEPCSTCGSYARCIHDEEDEDGDPFCPRCGEQLFGFENGPLCDHCTYDDREGDLEEHGDA